MAVSQRCLYPVRVRTNAPWDMAWPGERPCGKPATDRFELAFYLDGYREPGLIPHKTELFGLAVCKKHARFLPSLRIVGPHAADLVESGP